MYGVVRRKWAVILDAGIQELLYVFFLPVHDSNKRENDTVALDLGERVGNHVQLRFPCLWLPIKIGVSLQEG